MYLILLLLEIPQFIYSDGVSTRCSPYRIAITQPRRVAAISLSKRVADEMGVALGDIVGYSVRFDEVSSCNTCIKFLTDGMLIRELMYDHILSQYDVIIIDEAHERTLRSDILLGFIRKIQLDRFQKKKLKLIIMSATMNTEIFSQFYEK